MTVKEFVEKYKEDSSIVDSINYKHYIAVGVKMQKIDALLSLVHFTEDKFKLRTSFVHVILPMILIDEYTDLEVNFDNVLTDYDLLCEQNLIAEIIQKINPKEVTEFTGLLEKCQSDMVMENTATHAYVTNSAEKFAAILGNILFPVLDQLVDVVKDLDPATVKQLDGFLSKIVPAVKEEKPKKTTRTKKTK